jgi:flagellin-like protein
MKRILNKKGITPLIATVMLIAVTIAIFGTIFFWLRGMISENVQKFDSPIEKECDNVVFTASVDSSGYGKITVSNEGNVPIIGMNIKAKNSGKTLTKSIRKPFDGVISPAETDVIELELGVFKSGDSQRTITPVIQGKGVKTGKMSRYVCKSKALDLPI